MTTPPPTREERSERALRRILDSATTGSKYAQPEDILEDPEAFGGTDDGAETLAMVYDNLKCILSAIQSTAKTALHPAADEVTKS